MPDAELPVGMQAGPSPEPQIPEQLVDEMGVQNPVYDVSKFVKYRYYKCQRCGKKEFAGAMDMEEYVDCPCVAGPVDPKTKKTPHGQMKLLVYVSRRDKLPMTTEDYEEAKLQK
jgi:hypothetical protein